MAGSGRRFALEALFLVALAVAAGLADLSAARIVGVMALGWLLTALVELASWRLAVRQPAPVAVSASRVETEAAGAPHAIAAEAEEEEPAPEQVPDVAERSEAPGDSQPVLAEAGDEPLAEQYPGETVTEAEPEPVAGEAVFEAVAESDAPVPEPVGDAGEPTAGAGELDEEPGPRLEPLQPRPRRRPFWRRARDEQEDVDLVPQERPSRRHVRLISRPADPDDEDTAERRVEER